MAVKVRSVCEGLLAELVLSGAVFPCQMATGELSFCKLSSVLVFERCFV